MNTLRWRYALPWTLPVMKPFVAVVRVVPAGARGRGAVAAIQAVLTNPEPFFATAAILSVELCMRASLPGWQGQSLRCIFMFGKAWKEVEKRDSVCTSCDLCLLSHFKLQQPLSSRAATPFQQAR